MNSKCGVQSKRRCGSHEHLEEIQTLIPFLEQHCRVLGPVNMLVVENGSQVLVLVDNFYLLRFDLKRDGRRGIPPEVFYLFLGLANIKKQNVLVTPF